MASILLQLVDRFQRTDLATRVTALAFRPDGRQLVSAHDGRRLGVWDTSSWSLLQCGKSDWDSGRFTQIQFLKEHVYAFGPDAGFIKWNLVSEQLESRYSDTPGGSHTVLSPHGKLVASANRADGFMGYAFENDPILILQSYRTGRALQILKVQDLYHRVLHLSPKSLLFSPDSRYLAFVLEVSDDNRYFETFRIWIAGRSLTKVYNEEYNQARLPIFSPDSQWIAFLRSDRDWTLSVLPVSGLDSPSTAEDIYGIEELPIAMCFSPDSQHILTAGEDKTITIWPFRGDHRPEVISTPETITALVFSPDGRTLVAGDVMGGWSVYGEVSSKCDVIQNDHERPAK